MIEKYITTIAILILLKSFWIFVKPFPRKRKKGFKKMYSYMTSEFPAKYIVIFQLALVWLIVFFFSYIMSYINKLLMSA